MEAWLDVRHQFGSAAMEIEQLTLARDSEVLCGKLCKFLDLSPEQSDALRFALAHDHPEQTSSELGERTDLHSLGLLRGEENELKRRCDDLLRAYGYGYDAGYYE